VRPVGLTAAGGSGPGRSGLLECPDCEKWFWAHSGEEVPLLYEVCETAARDPDACFPDLREAVLWAGLSPSRRAEFNFLCAQCRSRSFRPVSRMSIVGGEGPVRAGWRGRA
jgi:hypothetical protein